MVSVVILLRRSWSRAFSGPFLFPFDGEDANFDAINQGVDFTSIHLFGTDNFGRDLLVRTLEGGRVSLTIGFLGALVAGDHRRALRRDLGVCRRAGSTG